MGMGSKFLHENIKKNIPRFFFKNQLARNAISCMTAVFIGYLDSILLKSLSLGKSNATAEGWVGYIGKSNSKITLSLTI